MSGVHVERLGVEASPADVAAVDAIARASFDPAFSSRDELGRPWSRLWIARLAEGAAPSAFLATWHVVDELHVLNVATSPELRRRGLGLALMEEALRYAAREGVRLLLLEVRRSNRPAIKLYRRLGFHASGVRVGYYADNGEDAIEMMLRFDPEAARPLLDEDEIRLDD